MARPTKYSEDKVVVIERAIEDGLTYEFAAALAGITDDTLSNWRKRYSEFSERIAAAEARGALVNIQSIREAAAGAEDRAADWRAAAWILEHRHPYQYGKSVTENQHTGKDGGPIEFAGLDVPLPVRQDEAPQ